MLFSHCTFDPSFLGKNYAKESFYRLSLPVDMDGGEFWRKKQQNFDKGMISS